MLTITNEDCMNLMARYPDKHFDLAIVDPPYGIGEGDGHRNNTGDRKTAKWANPVSVKYKSFDDTNTPDSIYFNELLRVSKNQIVWGGNYFSEYLKPNKGWVVWNKKVNEAEHLSMCELAWTSFDKRVLMFEFLWAGFKKQEQEKRIHPTQKPVALYKWLLDKYAKQGNKILDTHMGSGSIAIACHQLGFDLTACELDKEYYEAALKRIELNTRQTSIF